MKEEKPGKDDKQDRKGKRNERNGAGGAAPRKISYCDCCCVRYADLKKVPDHPCSVRKFQVVLQSLTSV